MEVFLEGRTGFVFPPLRSRGLLAGGDLTGLDSSSSLLLEEAAEGKDSACKGMINYCVHLMYS